MITPLRYLSLLEPYQFKRYIPSSFDETFTLLEKVDWTIDHLNDLLKEFSNLVVQTNEEMERQRKTINELIQQFNNLKDWIEGDGLSATLLEIMNEWFDNGKLAEIINEGIFNMKLDTSYFEKSTAFYTTPEQFAETGTGGDDSQAIQQAINALGSNGGTVKLTPNKRYRIGRTVFVPYNVSIDGAFAEIIPIGTERINGFCFYINAREDGSTIQDFGGEVFGDITYLRFNNRENVSEARGIYSRSKTNFKALTFNAFHQIYVKSGSANRDYTDMITFDRVYAINMRGTQWMIDISFNGDGVAFLNCHVAGAVASSNWNFLQMSFCNGGIVDRQINGHMRFNKSTAISVRSVHIEVGSVIFESTDFKLEASFFWYRRQYQPIPIIVRNSNNRQARSGSISDTLIIHFPNQTGLSETYDEDYFDLLALNANLSITNVFRRATSLVDPSIGMDTAIKISTDGTTINPTWEKYSQAYAKKSEIVGTRFFTPINYAKFDSNFNVFNIGTSANFTFLQDAGVYHYRVVPYFGNIDRRIGRFASANLQVTVTASKNAPLVNFEYSSRLQLAIIRLYRGREAGVYTHYVDIPIGTGLELYDLGYFMSTGERWKARNAGAHLPFNTSFEEMTYIGDNMKMKGISTPTTGMFYQGDTIDVYTPNSYSEIRCIETGDFSTESPPRWVTR